jgi:hypothetical protein
MMQLSPEDAELFFKLMPALQTFANRELKIIKNLPGVEQYQKVSNEQRVKLRNAFYKRPELIDGFVRENPSGFSPDELAVVSSWKNFVAGDFFIDRILKKYAIFVGNNKVYGVLALVEPLQTVLGGMPLPAYVKTVLLPFKGKIIYDGLIEGYNIFFGPGISGSMSNTYRAAKQQGKIIESLDPGWQPPEPKIRVQKDWSPLLEDLLEQASKLRATKDDPAVFGPVFNLTRVSLDLARNVVENPQDVDALDKYLRKIERTVNKARETMFYSDFEF